MRKTHLENKSNASHQARAATDRTSPARRAPTLGSGRRRIRPGRRTVTKMPGRLPLLAMPFPSRELRPDLRMTSGTYRQRIHVVCWYLQLVRVKDRSPFEKVSAGGTCLANAGFRSITQMGPPFVNSGHRHPRHTGHHACDGLVVHEPQTSTTHSRQGWACASITNLVSALEGVASRAAYLVHNSSSGILKQ